LCFVFFEQAPCSANVSFTVSVMLFLLSSGDRSLLLFTEQTQHRSCPGQAEDHPAALSPSALVWKDL